MTRCIDCGMDTAPRDDRRLARCDFTDAPINQPDRWHSERLNARLTGAAEQKLREIVEAARNGSLNVSKLLAIAIWLTEKSEE